MKVYLVQHGRPVSKEENPDRPLSPEGKRDVELVAGLLGRRGIGVGKVLHSGKTRARETAEILATALGPALEPESRKGLSPLDDVRDIAREIEEGREDLLIAGHLPHLGRLASLMLAGNPDSSLVNFRQGGVLCLERGEGGWGIAWMIVPEIADQG
ncbi:MAG: phosphohistidine phosphatase SixA [Deltaproteobacteria bacterium]|nr:phosphohistidine phosphatase SixA [Deltaproteobacteria bacterium]